MKLTAIWCKTYEPQKDWITSCYHLEAGKRNILFDLGRWAYGSLVEKGLWDGVTDIFLSHTHSDHIGDLLGCLHYAYWNPRKHISLHLPKGFKKWLLDVLQIIHGVWEDRDYITLKEYDTNETILLSGTKVTPFQAIHSEKIPCHGFCVEGQDKKFVYTWDTGYFDELSHVCVWADMIIADCNDYFLESTEWHMNYADVQKIMDFAKPKKVLLSHICCDQREQIEDMSMRKVGETEVIIAENGMIMEM